MCKLIMSAIEFNGQTAHSVKLTETPDCCKQFPHQNLIGGFWTKLTKILKFWTKLTHFLNFD